MSTTTMPSHPLVDALRERSPILHGHAQRLVSEAHRILPYTVSTFPGGTDHSPAHTTTVEVIGRMLLPDTFLAALTAEELFFLALACHYHDLAMAGTEADDRSPESREQVRRDHAIRIGKKIREKWAELGFENQRTAEVLGEVCRGHRPNKNAEGEANWDELNSVEVLGPGTSVRVRLVSALIYAIDELHLGADRAPARVQNWREIRDEESRRHWRRHRAVSGPTSNAGALIFQVSVETPGFEANLRSQVFRKALAAIRDLRRQAKFDGVTVDLPDLVLQWDRKNIWSMLLPLVCADMHPLGRDAIVRRLLERLAAEAGEQTDLTALCQERGSSEEELAAGARRCVDDAITYGHLTKATEAEGVFVLASEESVANDLFARMREADELDRLFLGRYRASWEERLFESAYGRQYVTRCVLPAIERSYSVRLAQRAADDPLRVVLELCPTAARLATDFRPPPSNLVKEVLLRQSAVTGALFDLHADPNRILVPRLRAAVHALTGDDPTTVGIVRLIEELALVGGFTPEQVSAAHDMSEAARQVLERDAPSPAPNIRVTLRQSIPASAPAATSQLPNLLLASHRAEVPIELASAPDHVLKISVLTDTPGARSEEPIAVGIGPSEPDPRGPGYLPARVELSRAERSVRFYLGRFPDSGISSYPVVVRIPPPPPAGEQPTVHFGLWVNWPCATIRDLRTLEGAGQLLRSGRATMELLLEEGGELLASLTPNNRDDVFRLGQWNAEVIRGFRGVDGSLPVPLLMPLEDIRAIGQLTPSARDSRWRTVREGPETIQREAVALYFRIANAYGRVIEERFLRLLSTNPFSAPTVGEGGSMTQEELNRQWTSGEVDFRLTAYFEPDVYEMVRLLREWCRNPRNEFPFNFRFGTDSTPGPVIRSSLTIELPRVIDRVWHRVRPVIFEFRPVSRAERYQLEAEYWRSVNDEARAGLAAELLARLEAAAGENTTPTNASLLVS